MTALVPSGGAATAGGRRCSAATSSNEIGLRRMEGLVLQVYKVVNDTDGSVMAAGFMPLTFETETEAFAYMMATFPACSAAASAATMR